MALTFLARYLIVSVNSVGLDQEEKKTSVVHLTCGKRPGAQHFTEQANHEFNIAFHVSCTTE